MEYILAFFIYSADCNLGQIQRFDCKHKRADYTDAVGSLASCQNQAASPYTKMLISQNYKRVWVVPHCVPKTREVAMNIKYYAYGL